MDTPQRHNGTSGLQGTPLFITVKPKLPGADSRLPTRRQSARRANELLRQSRQELGSANRTSPVLTGTPMENRVEEFRTLVGHLRPEIAAGVSNVDGTVGGTRFRKAVAPVYLRRNQDDVLSELPPRLETEEWVELDGKTPAIEEQAIGHDCLSESRRRRAGSARRDMILVGVLS